MKPAPFTVIVNAADPASVVAGEMVESQGVGLVIRKDAALETVPSLGFMTVTAAVPDAAKSLVEIAAFNCVGLT